MLRPHLLLVGSTALATMLSLTASAQECANGACANGACANGTCANGNVYGPEYSNGGVCQKGRGPAVLTPVEAFGVHPPGLDPADANRCFLLYRWRHEFVPYYAPLSPTSTSAPFQPWCYFPLMPYYTPYYTGYGPHRLCNPKPPPYGFDGGWGPGPRPEGCAKGPPGSKLNNFGAYTSVLQDDTIFWNMGGNGLVPYGAPRPAHSGPPDLVDMIQVTRRQGGSCTLPLGGAAVEAPFGQLPGSATTAPGETTPSQLPPANGGELRPGAG